MSNYINGREYGYSTRENNGKFMRCIPNQQTAGYPIGIVYVEEVNYPMLPGNVVNAYTYDFPVKMMAVAGSCAEKLLTGDESLKDDILEAANELVEKHGVRAICSACGFYGNFQKEIAAKVDVPVALSSLVQVPWVKSMLKPDEKVGILTCSGVSITDNLLNNCNISREDVIIKGMEDSKEFYAVVDMRGHFNVETARNEIVDRAMEFLAGDAKVGAIVLECSDMPPFSADIQAATQLPVFDFITLIKWMCNAVQQRPYSGWI